MTSRKDTMSEYYDTLESPVGRLYMIFSRDRAVGISFHCPTEISLKHNNVTALVKKELAEYFRNERTEFSSSVEFLEGTAFEKKVWSALKEVPYRETRIIRMACREAGYAAGGWAVGNALAKNPVPIIFPCHRIIDRGGVGRLYRRS